MINRLIYLFLKTNTPNNVKLRWMKSKGKLISATPMLIDGAYTFTYKQSHKNIMVLIENKYQ